MIFHGGRSLVCVGRPERGFHISYRRRGGGAYISSERGFSKIDERAGLPPRAKTRCIQVPHLVFMIARGGELAKEGERWIEGEKKYGKIKYCTSRDATRRVAKNSRHVKTQCALLAHGDGSLLAILSRHFVSRGSRFIGSRVNVKHCTCSVSYLPYEILHSSIDYT